MTFQSCSIGCSTLCDLVFAMDEPFRGILDSLPPKHRRSKLELEPYVDLIRELRACRRSYREIVAILRDRCDLRVGLHTVYNFVRVRVSTHTAARRLGRPRSSSARSSSASGLASRPASPSGNEGVWKRISAVRERAAPPSPAEHKEFEYDENEPLQLVEKRKKE